MTVLEVAHSQTESEIEGLLRRIEPMLPEITDYTFHHPTKLIKPFLSYDNQALALGFLPASSDESKTFPDAKNTYTYHHLRRDIYNLCRITGVNIGSRYVVPSAHLTLARFILSDAETNLNGSSSDDRGQRPSASEETKMAQWVGLLEDINGWLRAEYWPQKSDGSGMKEAEGEWAVGDEKGLECRMGTLWYGGGRSVRVGKGFEKLNRKMNYE